MKSLLQLHLKPLLEANIDYLVLGCTHYSYLIPLLVNMLPKHIKIIDSGEAVARQTKAILHQDSGAFNISDNWRERTKVIRPQFNEAMGRRVGVTKQDLDQLLQTNFSGKQVGLYREATTLLPIVTPHSNCTFDAHH